MLLSPDTEVPCWNPSRPRWSLPPLSCDTHAHLFGPANRYPFVAGGEYVPSDVLRADYARLIRTLGFDRVVLVQPSVYGFDNRLLLDALQDARQAPLGVAWRGVAVVPPGVPATELARMHALGVRGVRFNLVNTGANLSLEDARALAPVIHEMNWHMQFMVDVSTFEDVFGFFSGLRCRKVFDHVGYFPVEKGRQCAGFGQLLRLLDAGDTWVKISGLNRVSDPGPRGSANLAAILTTLAARAPERLLYGTDWPHIRLSTAMPDDGVLLDRLFQWLGEDEALMRCIFTANPGELYQFA